MRRVWRFVGQSTMSKSKEGRQPLCAFLGVPVPAGELFPHLNDATDFSRRQRDQYRHIARMLRPVLGVAITGPALALGLSRRRERRLGRG